MATQKEVFHEFREELDKANRTIPGLVECIMYYLSKLENASGGGGGGSSVSWNQIQNSGTKVAEIIIDGVKTNVLVPESAAEIFNHAVRYDTDNDKLEYYNENNDTWIEIELPTPSESGINYSLDEQIIGTWIDGSDLFQKTINFGALPNATTKSIAHGISNIDASCIIKLDAIANTNNYAIFPRVHDTSVNNQVFFEVTDTNIIAYSRSADNSSYTRCYVTIQYIKKN